MKTEYIPKHKKFRRNCPNCRKPDKVVVKCRVCLKFCCRDCSIDFTCHDCYLESKKSAEISRYYREKYESGVNVHE